MSIVGSTSPKKQQKQLQKHIWSYILAPFSLLGEAPYKHIVILKTYLRIYWEFESGGGLGPPKHLSGFVFVSTDNLPMYCQLILHWMLQYGISSKLSRVMDQTILIDCPLVCAIIALCFIVFPELQIIWLHLHVRIRDCTCVVVLQLVHTG